MKVTYNNENLSKHSVTREQVDEVTTGQTTIECELPPSQRGDERTMLVGFTSTGRLLEVGIELIHAEQRMHIFHAKRAGKVYRQKFEKRVRSL